MKIQAGVPGVARGIKKNEFEEKTIKKYLLIFNKKVQPKFGPIVWPRYSRNVYI